MQYRSRLKNRVKSTLYKNTIITIGAIVLFFIFFLFFGLQLLVKFSLFLGGIKSINEITSSSQESFIFKPVLNPMFEATNSAVIEVSGIGQAGQTIELFTNAEKKTEALVDSNSQFAIAQLRLEIGENRVKVRAKQDGKESEFTEEIIVLFDTTPPALEIKEPTDGQVFKGTPQVHVVGKTEQDTQVVINEFFPIVDADGGFSYTLPLKEGDNVIKIAAKDKAGNQTTQELKVSYQP